MTWTGSDRKVRAGLDDEWAELVRQHCAHWWPDDDPGGAAAGVVEQCQRHDDQTWARVLTAAQEGEAKAARAALQAMLPSLVRLARRDQTRPLADYVTAAWLRIYDFPIMRRNHRVLTNLVMDTLKALTRERDRRACPRPPEWFDVPAEPVAERAGMRADELITAAARIGVIAPASATVLRSVYAEGLSGQQAAERHHQTPEMVRYRCSRSVRAMRDARAQLMAAA